MNDLSQLKVSSSPHIRSAESTSQIMIDVIISLMPALAVATYVFGARCIVLTVISVVSCKIFEHLYCKLMHKPSTIGDYSSAVTGVLLAFCLPVSVPLWMPVLGAAFAIIIVKELYGGIVKNFMNSAMTSRAFLMASFPALMTVWVKVRTKLPVFLNVTDAVTSATPLDSLKQGVFPPESLSDMALGMTSGCIGEISALALIAGGLYLIYRRVVTLHIPLSFIGTVALISFIFPKGMSAFNAEYMLYSITSGGLMLGAVFMATDYTTSPVTPKGQIIYGAGAGLITVFIRYFGSYPEGVTYGILIMNALVFLIEKITVPKKFGASKNSKEAADK
ncbi:MAG: RnfABCDGE type electron transport complex subunit D [Clostridia bacterium]|nr:RnfABCDGE type electron transport complex subunit D [Clostridia bacterium]